MTTASNLINLSTRTIGTGSFNLLSLDITGGLPPVDGSKVTNLTASQVSGILVKSFVNLTGSTGAIKASSGISSINRTTTGTYTVNFSSAFADVNYAAAGMGSDACTYTLGSKTTTSCVIQTKNSNSFALVDMTDVSFIFFR